jgi:hypothetical protein
MAGLGGLLGGGFEERWTGSRARTPNPGRYTIAVKVIDILGEETISLAPVTVG